MKRAVRELLLQTADELNNRAFIVDDPVSIPHRFSKKQDIEIAGFFAAIMSWGNRKTIIRKASELMDRMDNDPHRFVLNASSEDLKSIEGFVHRTLNTTDVLFLIDFLKRHYSKNHSLESAFFKPKLEGGEENLKRVEDGLINFRNNVFNVDWAPNRTSKHIATPLTGSACKRLNMFLRWMVRKDKVGVDFGIWKQVRAAELICPLDVHVQRVALKLELIESQKANWKTALELTAKLKELDPFDPVKFDYALFGLGVMIRDKRFLLE